MAEGFEYFTSADAGAPILHGAAGRMIAVLDWALVSKGGWDKAYTDTNLAAYRSQTGNRFYLAVDDTQTTYARLRGYRTMSDVSTGTDQFPPASAAPTTTWGMGKSAAAGDSSNPRRYWGVRSDRYIFMIADMHPTTTDGLQRCAFCFGDVPSLCETDLFNTIIMGGPNPHTIHFPQNYFHAALLNPRSGLSLSSSNVCLAATPDGSFTAPASVLGLPFSIPTGILQNDVDAFNVPGRLQYAEPIIWSQQTGFSGTATPCYPRCRLPNVKIGAGVIPITDLVDMEVIEEAGRQFILLTGIRSTAYSYSFAMLEMTDTDGML